MVLADKLLLRSSPSEDTTPETGIMLGHALSIEHTKVVVGTDLMKSSQMMKNALIAGLVSSGVDVIDVGEVSGPVIAYAAKMGDCAVYVTEFRQMDLMSGYLLMNKDGGYFGIEQIRHLDSIFSGKITLPDYRSLGTVKRYYNAVSDYNNKVLSILKDTPGGSMVLNCNCGLSTDSAPQIMNSLGADIVSVNAHKDRNFISNSLSTKEADILHMKILVEANAGAAGISFNRIGTLFRVFDETGIPLTNEEVLAILILYMKPKKIVVPMDIMWFIEDVYRGKVKTEVSSPYPDPDAEETEFIVAYPSAGDVHDAMVENNADLGYYDGGFIFGDVSYSPDSILAAILITQFCGNNTLSETVKSFPEYYTETKTYRISCPKADFVRMIGENLPDVSPIDIMEKEGCWRVYMTGGGFYVSLDEDSEDSVTVLAESNDKLYLISLMEVIDGLMESCASGQ